jgi:peroxiredoxin
MLKAGDKAPDFELPRLRGEAVHLYQELEQGRHVLLIFLRYLG